MATNCPAISSFSLNPVLHRNHHQGRVFTDAKIKQLVISSFATLSLIAGSILLCTSISGVLVSPFAFLSLPLFAGSVALFYWAIQIKDYKNPNALAVMRSRAFNQTFSQMIKKHGLDNIVDYKIVTEEQLKQKFETEMQTEELLPSGIGKYSLSAIHEYNLASQDWLQRKFFRKLQNLDVSQFYEFSMQELQECQLINGHLELSRIWNAVKDQESLLDTRRRSIDKKHPERLNLHLHALHQQESEAQQKAESELRQIDASESNQILNIKLLYPDRIIHPIRSNPSYCVIRPNFFGEIQLQSLRTVADAKRRKIGYGLQTRLMGISEKRGRISMDQTCCHQQQCYDQEISEAKRYYTSEIAKINAEFQRIKPTLLS